MKIGVNTWVWTSPFSTKDFHLIPKVKQMGFDVLEVALDDASIIDAKLLRKMTEDNGRRDYTLNPTTHGPTNGLQFRVDRQGELSFLGKWHRQIDQRGQRGLQVPPAVSRRQARDYEHPWPSGMSGRKSQPGLLRVVRGDAGSA